MLLTFRELFGDVQISTPRVSGFGNWTNLLTSVGHAYVRSFKTCRLDDASGFSSARPFKSRRAETLRFSLSVWATSERHVVERCLDAKRALNYLKGRRRSSR